MPRGTTPTHTWTLPFDASLVKAARAVYKQNGVKVVCKETADFVMEGNTIKTTLTQEETLRISCDFPVRIQLRILTQDGTAMKTPVYVKSVRECLDDEVL